MDRSTFFTCLALMTLPLALPGAAPETSAPRVVTLSMAREIALRDNPGLLAADAQYRASQGAAKQAAGFLNPSVELRKEDFGYDAPVQQVAPQETLSFSQPIRTAGKRAAQRDAAKWAGDAALQDLGRERLDVMAEVDRRFARLLGAQESAGIAAENLATASEVAAAVSALVDAGEVSPVELSRAENDRDMAAIDLQNARRDEEVARRDLAAVLGQETPLFERAEGALAQQVVLPDPSRSPEALGGSPDLARWDAETKSLEASLQLAKRTPWPDLTFAVGVRRYTLTGERAYVAGLALPLPLFNQNRGAVVEASALLDQGRLRRRAEEVRLKNAFAAARLVLERAGSEVTTMNERILPNAQKIFEALNEGYKRGQFRLLDLLEARRSLAQARLRFVDALVRLNVAKADMDRLLASAPAPVQGVTP